MTGAVKTLLDEGKEGKPKMCTIGASLLSSTSDSSKMPAALHARLIGQPGRFQGLKTLVETLTKDPDVWFATREQIARQWVKQYPDPYTKA